MLKISIEGDSVDVPANGWGWRYSVPRAAVIRAHELGDLFVPKGDDDWERRNQRLGDHLRDPSYQGGHIVCLNSATVSQQYFHSLDAAAVA
jgi:hypothetical protein